MSLIVDQHREYLSDSVRLDLFRRAIAECVRPGAVVADIGSGTGILGLLACQAGAARVYAIEATGMAEIARALAAANGYADRFHVIQAHSLEVDLPERVDVCVSDFVGHFGFDAGLFEIYPSARARLLRPGGVLLPSALSLFIAPVEHAAIDAQVRFWTAPRAGFDVSPAFKWAVNRGYPVAFDAADLLGPPALVVETPTSHAPESGFRADVQLTLARPGTLHGLGGWCAAQLSPGVAMTNSPLSAERINRRNVFLPLTTPVAVSAGDRVRVRLSILPADYIVSWTVAVTTADGTPLGRQSQSTLSGMLVSRDDLKRSKPDFVPVLTPRGVARFTTLQLCDGVRTLRDVESQVFERHRDLFSSPGAAAAFVAEVVSGYARL